MKVTKLLKEKVSATRIHLNTTEDFRVETRTEEEEAYDAE